VDIFTLTHVRLMPRNMTDGSGVCALGEGSPESEKPMSIKTLSAIFVVSTLLSSPVLAQPPRGSANDSGQVYQTRALHGAYNQALLNEPFGHAASRARDSGDWELGRDPSYPGGLDPSFRPAAN
jgi:hypothetical protein